MKFNKLNSDKLNIQYILLITGLVAGLLIGMTFLISGIGKIIGFEETPAQVVDFLSNIIPEFFITPALLSFLYKIFIPYMVPWIELIIGLSLIFGFVPRLMSIISIPLILSFMGTNIWSIVQGGYISCANCFGFWESIFGSLTPLQSLIYDIVLLVLALVIIFLHPGRLLSSRDDFHSNMDRCKKFFSSLYQACLPGLTRIWQVIKQYRGIAVGLITVIVIVIIVIIGLNIVEEEPPEIAITGISTSEISYNSAVISWFTSELSISRVIIYDSSGNYFREQIEIIPVMEHKAIIAGLSEETGYYYEISTGKSDIPEELLTRRNYFETGTSVLEPLSISDVRVSLVADSSVKIAWNTDRESSYVMEYWPANYPQLTEEVVEETLKTEHSVVLSGLSPETVYSIRLTADAADGAQDIAEFNNFFSVTSGLQPGMFAPDFSLETLDGGLITLSDYRGKAVLLDFWSWTCSACRAKLPMIQEIYNSVPAEDIAVLGIHYEGKNSVIENFILNEGVSFPVLMDVDAGITMQYGIESFPTVIIIDRDGFIRASNPGFSDVEELREIVKNVITPD